MEKKDTYTIKELFDELPITLAELGRRSSVNEVTVARIRHGKGKPRRSTVNRVLKALSEVYGVEVCLKNVEIEVTG